MAVRLPKSETWIIVPARVNAARLMPRESLAEADIWWQRRTQSFPLQRIGDFVDLAQNSL
jgi:hypothetical protein